MCQCHVEMLFPKDTYIPRQSFDNHKKYGDVADILGWGDEVD